MQRSSEHHEKRKTHQKHTWARSWSLANTQLVTLARGQVGVVYIFKQVLSTAQVVPVLQYLIQILRPCIAQAVRLSTSIKYKYQSTYNLCYAAVLVPLSSTKLLVHNQCYIEDLFEDIYYWRIPPQLKYAKTV